MIRTLDLFSGIGGNTLALQGMCETVAYCEFDKHAQAVLKSRMDDGLIQHAPIFPDVTTLKGSDVGGVDMIVGGFPCQDISVAGKGAGIAEGTRSGLFYQIMRLTDELQPRFLFLENVPAIRKRGLDIVLRELTERRYDCRWTMLSAAQVGARHKRERWFMLANRRDSEGANAEHIGWDAPPFRESDQASVCDSQKGPDGTSEFKGVGTCGNVAHASGQRRQQVSDSTPCDEGKDEGWTTKNNYLAEGHGGALVRPRVSEPQSRLGGMADGISEGLDESLPDYLRAGFWEEEPCARVTQEREQRVERIKRLGNSVVPLQARAAFIYLMSGFVQ